MLKIYDCVVYLKGCGADVYVVVAENPEEAEKRCRERLNSETDEGERWEIVRIEEVKKI